MKRDLIRFLIFQQVSNPMLVLLLGIILNQLKEGSLKEFILGYQ
jgi:hypothetical protein